MGTPALASDMKSYLRLRLGIVGGLCLLVVSCAHVSETTTSTPQRFRDGDTADLVLRFYSWDSIYVMRPDSREDGFLPLFSRASISQQLDRPDIKRDLVVVVLGYLYSRDQQADILRDWKSLLDERGFRRVVFLRGTGHKTIDGLPVLRDTAVAGGT